MTTELFTHQAVRAGLLATLFTHSTWKYKVQAALVLVVGSMLLLAVVGCATAAPTTVKDGCAVNLKKVCQFIIDDQLDKGGFVATDDGQHLDRQRLQNISVRHFEMLIPWRGTGAQLRCVLDTQTARVTDGHISEGPQLNDADIAWVRQNGLCQ